MSLDILCRPINLLAPLGDDTPSCRVQTFNRERRENLRAA